MSQSLHRSYSVNQTSRPVTSSSLNRSISSAESHRSSSTSSNVLKNVELLKCFSDVKAQIDYFIKEYLLSWDLSDATVVLRYSDAKKRLPGMAAQLDTFKLESLLVVKKILQKIEDNLVNSLKPSAQKDSSLSSYLADAEKATGNAMVLCVNGAPDFRFNKFEQKDLYSSVDKMSAAMIIQQYFANAINGLGRTS